MLGWPYGESTRLFLFMFGLRGSERYERGGLKGLGGTIWASLTTCASEFSVFRVLDTKRNSSRNEAQFGISAERFDGHLVMRLPFGVVHGIAVSGRVGKSR